MDSKYENIDDLNFTWDFGDREKSFGNKTNHTFEKSGQYLVTLKNMKPDAKFSLRNKTVFADEFFALTSESSDFDGEIIKFEWEIEGVKIHGESIVYSFREAGNQTIILRVFDNLGDSSVLERKIEVLEKEKKNGGEIVKVEDETDLTFVYLLLGVLIVLICLMLFVMLKTEKKGKIKKKEKEAKKEMIGGKNLMIDVDLK